MAAAQGLVDTKLLSRPPRYSNNRAEWPLFKFMMRTYVGAISEELLDAMNQAEAQAGRGELEVK